ncbi:unnamed protein product [Ectocarpus sp. 6 AP-2014]
MAIYAARSSCTEQLHITAELRRSGEIQAAFGQQRDAPRSRRDTFSTRITTLLLESVPSPSSHSKTLHIARLNILVGNCTWTQIRCGATSASSLFSPSPLQSYKMKAKICDLPLFKEISRPLDVRFCRCVLQQTPTQGRTYTGVREVHTCCTDHTLRHSLRPQYDRTCDEVGVFSLHSSSKGEIPVWWVGFTCLCATTLHSNVSFEQDCQQSQQINHRSWKCTTIVPPSTETTRGTDDEQASR